MTVEIDGQSIEINTLRPRWENWKQRKYARAWCAVLLTLNIEPSIKNRKVLKEFHPSVHQDYLDRVNVVRARIGMDIFAIEDHCAEGKLPAEKMLELVDIVPFAKELNWQGIEEMEKHFPLKKDSPVSQKKQNGQLRLMHAVLKKAVQGFSSSDPSLSAKLVQDWLKNESANLVEVRTLKVWISEIDNAITFGEN